MTDPRPADATPDVALDPGARTRLAEVAAARGRLWSTVAELLDGSPSLTVTLRTDALPAAWRTGVALFAGQTPAADRALLVLQTHARAARRRDEAHDARAFAQVHAQVIAPWLAGPSAGCPVSGDDARADAHAIATLCAHESTAWAVGDAERARAARHAQLLRCTGDLEHVVWGVGRALALHEGPLWRALGTLVQTFVATETGRVPAA